MWIHPKNFIDTLKVTDILENSARLALRNYDRIEYEVEMEMGLKCSVMPGLRGQAGHDWTF